MKSFRVEPIDSTEPTVFYACYGSNLLGGSFMDYMNQGRSWQETRFVPADFESARVFLPHNMYYSSIDEASGAAAFLDVDHDGFTLGRIYKLSYHMFEVLALSESRVPIVYDLPWDHILNNRETILDAVPGHYGRIVNLGECNGTPVLTVTTPKTLDQRVADGDLDSPMGGYVNTILMGVMDTMRLPYASITPR